MFGFISSSSVLFHWSTCLPLYHAVFNHCCFVVLLEVRDGDSARCSFTVENSFGYPVFVVVVVVAVVVISDVFSDCSF